MNLKKIKKISDDRKITLSDLAIQIGMTYQNLNRCIRENKIMANDLEEIAIILKVPVSCFFEEKTESSILEESTYKRKQINCSNCEQLLDKIELLRDQLQDKNKLIELLEKQNNRKA